MKLIMIALCVLPITVLAGPDMSSRTMAADTVKKKPNASPIDQAKYTLEGIYSCEEPATPIDVKNLVALLNGQQIISGGIEDVEYTLGRPLNIFGREIRRISVHKNENEDGEFTEYSSIFSGEELGVVAHYAGVNKDSTGQYIQSIGGSDLIFRSEHGETSIVCARNVRTISKTLKKTWRSITEPK